MSIPEDDTECRREDAATRGHTALNIPGWPIPPSCDECGWVDLDPYYPAVDRLKALKRQGWLD